MLLLKANPELKKVFSSLIKTMKVPVTWTDTFVVINNSLVLAGDIRSLVFNFDTKKASTNIIEIPSESTHLETMPNDALLNNTMNMVLYVFGKWGGITGLKVEKDYAALNSLFERVLRPVNIEPGLSTENFRFYKDGMQITYEDTMLAILRLLKNEGKLKEGQSLATSESQTEDERISSGDAAGVNTASLNDIDIPDEEEDYKIGLWHSLCWKKDTCDFQKTSQTSEDSERSRIGNDFYITNYQCPNCGHKLYLGVYPTDKELLIETDEGRVFMARTYACRECNTFYTPRPGKLLQEGDIYSLKFDEDRVAFEDYLEILGTKAQRTTNYKFNEYEADRSRKKGASANAARESADDMVKPAPSSGIKGLTSQLFKNSSKFLSKNKKKQEDILPEEAPDDTTNILSYEPLEELEPPQSPIRELSQALSQETARPQKQASQNTVPSGEKAPTVKPSETLPTEKPSVAKTPSATASVNTVADATINTKQPATISAQDKLRLSQKTTEELKSILAASDSREPVYKEAVEEVLRTKLTAKYDARMGALNKLSQKQLADLKKQISKETVLPKEQKTKYEEKIDSLLYRAEEGTLEQKVELSKNKTYAEIEQMIADVENRNLPDELKRETLQKLKRTKADRAVREVEHLLTHMPLHLNRKQLSTYLNKLDQYKEVDLTPYRRQLEERKDMAEREEISAMIKRGGKKDRNALWDLYEQLQQKDYSEKNKAPYLEKIYEKIRRMDEDAIEEICPSIVTLSFNEGLKVYDQINQGVFLPELKTNTLEMIKRRLTKLKTDESVQLMRKLKRDIDEKLPDYNNFYFYDAREELKSAQSRNSLRDNTEESEDDYQDGDQNHAAMMRAVNGYAAARGPYEYPLMVYDTSRSGNGKEGLVLTPDHIFYHAFLTSDVINIPDISKVQASRKIFGKGIFAKSYGGQKIKLPNTLSPKHWKVFSEILDDFITYLQEKPESRSLEYMAAEKHDIIRCYRCGFAYKGGNVCPKCGSKMNH